MDSIEQLMVHPSYEEIKKLGEEERAKEEIREIIKKEKAVQRSLQPSAWKILLGLFLGVIFLPIGISLWVSELRFIGVCFIIIGSSNLLKVVVDVLRAITTSIKEIKYSVKEQISRGRMK